MPVLGICSKKVRYVVYVTLSNYQPLSFTEDSYMNKKLQKPVNKLKGLTTALSTAILMLPATSFADDGFNKYNGTSGDKIVGGVRDFIGKIGTWAGGLYAAVAIFTLILAIRNEDNEGRNKAALNLVAAIALTFTSAIIGLFFNN